MSDVTAIDATPTLLSCLKAHNKPVTDLTFHPDNVQLASCSLGNSVVLCNLSFPDRRCYNFMGHTDQVTAVEFSNSGKLLASCSRDKSVRLWVPTIEGRCGKFVAHTATVTTVCFSPDDRKLLTGSYDKSLKIWQTQEQSFLGSFSGHTNWVRCAKFSPDGNTAFSCADDKTIRVWDVANRQCIHVFTSPNSAGNCLAVHRNGYAVAVSMNSGSVRLYDTRAQKLQQHYVLHDTASSVAWHPYANYLLTSGVEGTMKIVDVMEGKPLYTLTCNSVGVNSAKFSADGEKFASAGADKNIQVWSTSFIIKHP